MQCEETQTSFVSVSSLHQLVGLSQLQDLVQLAHSPLRKRLRSCSKQVPLQQRKQGTSCEKVLHIDMVA